MPIVSEPAVVPCQLDIGGFKHATVTVYVLGTGAAAVLSQKLLCPGEPDAVDAGFRCRAVIPWAFTPTIDWTDGTVRTGRAAIGATAVQRGCALSKASMSIEAVWEFVVMASHDVSFRAKMPNSCMGVHRGIGRGSGKE
jgi:hypothetical protein